MMRAFKLLVAATLSIAPVLHAQTAAQATGQGASVPSADGGDGSPSGGEFRVGGYYVNGQRNYFFNKTQSATGSLTGFEMLLRGPGVGLAVRYYDGQFGTQPDLIAADANVLFGARVFSVEGGYAKRALSSPLGTTVYTFGRAGVHMEWVIGGTGLTSVLGGAYYLPAGSASGAGQGDIKSGMEGEASLIYNFPAVPLFVQLGYRTEVFTAKNASTQIPEEVRGLRLGGGIQFGGK